MLSKETKIMLHGSKIKIDKIDEEIILENISFDLNWEYFFYQTVHHRVVPLVFNSLKKMKLLNYIENNVRRAMENISKGIYQHNELVYKEISKINQNFYDNGLKVVLLKGGILAPLIYKDIGLRQFGDIDYLMEIKDIPKATEILKDFGYLQGHYDVNENKIKQVTKKERILHRMNTHEIVEFIKLNDNINCNLFMIDINFEIFWKGKNNLKKFVFDTSDLIKNAELVFLFHAPIYSLRSEEQLIQLCAHLFSEAVYFCWHSNWIRDKSDLNLIKFCDIYELISSEKINWGRLAKIVVQNNIAEPIVYTLLLLKKIYDIYIPTNFFKSLQCEENITEMYFDKNGEKRVWKCSFEDRMFNLKIKEREIVDNNVL